MSNKNENSFVPRERNSLPRILLLDFEDSYKEFLEGENYSVYLGDTGFSLPPLCIPLHESEVEILFWDTSNLRTDGRVTLALGDDNITGQYGMFRYRDLIDNLTKYFAEIRRKGGFVGIFLGDTIHASVGKSSDMLGCDFSFQKRATDTMYLHQHEEDDVWYEFYNRFIEEKDIQFSIEWRDNPDRVENVLRYFGDEDDNVFAVSYDYFAIIPKIGDKRRKREALRFLLQDVLPYFCRGQDIFPSKYYYRWAGKNIYMPSRVSELKKCKTEIEKHYEEQMKKVSSDIAAEIENSEYLSTMLIADDSDLFPNGKKLSDSVHRALEGDLGFCVTDVDEMRLNVGESLKEDKWLEDTDGFFALVEIKGTERGAKSNWIRQDLNAHIREFMVLKGITELNSILIFNHERRVEPESRTEPFSGDSDLISYCEKSDICLLSVYELFKLARDVKEGSLAASKARDAIKRCKGLFAYNP